MYSLLFFLEDYVKSLGLLSAFIVFIFSVYRYWHEKMTEIRWKEFEVYHKLIKELVEPDKGEPLYIDRQAAIIYELRNFKRYYEYSLRMLVGLEKKWGSSDKTFPRLLDEIRIAINFLRLKTDKKCVFRFFYLFLRKNK